MGYLTHEAFGGNKVEGPRSVHLQSWWRVPLSVQGTTARKRKTATRKRWTIPWSTVVRPVPRVRRLTTRVSMSSNSSLGPRPSVKGLPRVMETPATAGMVSAMLANADPRAKFMLVWRRLALAARYAASPSGRRTSLAIYDANHASGRANRRNPPLERWRECLRQQDDQD